MSEKRTELADLGEFGLIDRINSNVKKRNPSSIYAIGDDAAVIERNENEYTLVSTDMLIEGIHFDLSYTPLKHLGFKSVAVNVSDIAAMNGFAEQITVSLALSNRFSVEAVEELYAGINAACEAYNVDLVGGDTTSSRSGLVISVTAIGKVDKNRIAYRSGAKAGDVICVTGDLGSAYVGLQLLEREKQVYMANPDMKPQLDNYDYQVTRLLKPEARMDLIHALKAANIIPNSMIDVSDGLASELLHIAKMSNVGIKVFEENIPIHNQSYEVALDFKISPTTATMNGGEDYELLFTLSKEEYEKVKKHPDIFAIGEVVASDEGKILVSKEGKPHDLEAQGWVHF